MLRSLAGTSGVSEIPIRDDALTQPEDAYCELPKHNAVYTNLLKIYENTDSAPVSDEYPGNPDDMVINANAVSVSASE